MGQKIGMNVLAELCEEHGVQKGRGIQETTDRLKAAGVKQKEITAAAAAHADAIKGEIVDDGESTVVTPKKKDKKNGKKEPSVFEKAKGKVVDGYNVAKEHLNKATLACTVEKVKQYSKFVLAYGAGIGLAAYLGMTLGLSIIGTLAAFGVLYLVSSAIHALMCRKAIKNDKRSFFTKVKDFFSCIWESLVADLKAAIALINPFRKVETAVKAK